MYSFLSLHPLNILHHNPNLSSQIHPSKERKPNCILLPCIPKTTTQKKGMKKIEKEKYKLNIRESNLAIKNALLS